MFRAFQVNEGRFLPLKSELSPTARSVERFCHLCVCVYVCDLPLVHAHRVSELSSAVKALSHEAEEDQVMLTSDGKQMDPADMIGAYSVGTVITC